MIVTPQTLPPPDAAEDDSQERLKWRDLQNAQITAMRHVWDNPEDEVWNDLPSVGDTP